MNILRKTVSKTFTFQTTIRRHYVAAFIIDAFNFVDYDRLQAVGPDRLCAEWIMKNGGRVRLHDRLPPPLPVESAVNQQRIPDDIRGTFFVDYNQLPDECEIIRIQEFVATSASITAVGFTHLRNCAHVERITLDNCRRLQDDALERLATHVAASLRVLQISNCPRIRDGGLLELVRLRRLQALCCFRLQGVEDMDQVREVLRNALPKDCDILLEPWSGKKGSA